MSLATPTRPAWVRARIGPALGRATVRGEDGRRSLSLVPNSLALIATKVATLGLGFLFWLVAARLFAPAQVGLAAGVVAAVLLCVQLALLGVGSAVIALFPRHQEAPGRLLDTALTTATVVGALVGAAFAALAAGAFPKLGVVGTRPGYLALFVAMSALGTVGVVLDQISTTLRRGDQALGRGVLNGGLSLVAVGGVGLIPAAGSMALFACWVVGVGAACALGAAQLRRALARYRYRPRLDRPLVARLIVVGLPNHALTLADRAPGLVLPVVVTELLSPAANAYWYAVWMMAWVVLYIPVQVGMTLFAEAAHRPAAIDGLVRDALRWALAVGLAAAALLAAVGGLVLSLLGARYAAAGTAPLRTLVCALLPMAFVQAYYARCRAFGRLREAVATAVVSGAVAVAAAAAAGVAGGLTAMALAWLGVQTLAGGWAAWRLRAMARARAATAAGARRRVAPAVAVAAPALAIAGALSLWIMSVRGIDLRAMSSLGLVSVLPPGAFAALALLGTSFCVVCLRGRAFAALLLAHVVALVFMLYGLPALVEPQARFAVTWRHVGLMQSILVTGHVDPHANAYFNWPGFFVLAGFMLRAAGLHDLLGVANWAPFAFQLLYVAPLLLILRAFTGDRRLVWLGVWIFLLGDWVGQDYFSPQAFVLLLYLVVFAVLLTWLRRGAAGASPPGSAGGRAGLVAIVLLLYAAMVPSHQLTPFAMLAAVALLVAGRCCAARGLPLTMLVILIVWLSYMTVGYLSGHSGVLLGQVGHLDTTLSENVSQRLHGDPGHVLVARARVVLTLALWGLAVAGAWSLRRAGHRDLAPVLLLLAPFVLVPLQPYGGEILLRVFLFSLPFTAFLAAAAMRRAPPALTVALTLALIGGFLVTRYGNERMDWFSGAEVRAVNRLDALAPAGSTLVAWSSSLPWQARDYGNHRYRTVVAADDWPQIARLPAGGPAQLRLIASLLRAQRGGAYLVITRSQEAEVDLTGLGPRGSLERVDAGLRRSPAFRLLYVNHDGSVYTLRNPGRRAR